MGRILYLDCFAGIAGDMLVGALLHAGAPLGPLRMLLNTLPMSGWQLRAETVQRGAFSATHVRVEPIPGASPAPSHDHGHDHSHDHGHDHSHDHGHDHSHAHSHGHGHDHSHADPDFPGQPHRRWRDIRAMLEGATALPLRARTRAMAAFERLAIAEGTVHGIPAEEVDFHEVGAVDSIIDVIGACVAMELLDIDTIVASPLPMGEGRIRTAHGLIPLPAPATLEVLRDFPVTPFPFPGEHVTPTGACIVAALARPGPLPAMRVEAIGYGAGTRDPSTHANILRVVIGQGEAGAVTEVAELRAQIDDLPGEAVPPLIEALFAAGAVDAWAQPIIMKKGRPALQIVAISPPDRREAVGSALMRHGGTFGYRWSLAPREVLARRHVLVTTPFGEVRIKIGEHLGKIVHAAPEYEDCAALARAASVPVATVFAATLAAWARNEA